MPPSDIERLFTALGMLTSQVSTLSDEMSEWRSATTEEHRKVHDIVVASSESVRIIARDVAEMKPYVEAYKLKASDIDKAVILADDYQEERAERRGADKFKKWLYGLWAGGGALLVFVLGKLWDMITAAGTRPPHPIVVILLLVMSSQALAHSFYDMECCHDQDCHPVACDQISETSDGFEFDGVRFARSMERPSQDRRCHVCIMGSGSGRRGLCIYTQQGS